MMLFTATVTCFADLTISVPVAVVLLLRPISGSINLVPSTAAMLKEEDPSQYCALFRHLPALAGRFAWRSLGVLPTTPMHTCRAPLAAAVAEVTPILLFKFFVQREDLLSSVHGGNEVRTLQHRLVVCEARRERGDAAARRPVLVGSGGSQWTVATAVHARGSGWASGDAGPAVYMCQVAPDAPDLDHILHMRSVLGLLGVGRTHCWGGAGGAGTFSRGMCAALTQAECVPMMPGGDCPSGVLGQAGGCWSWRSRCSRGRAWTRAGSTCRWGRRARFLEWSWAQY